MSAGVPTALAGEIRPALPASRQRLTSLDWARGVMVLLNLVVISVLPPSPRQLRHADWLGVTVFDIVFPLFVCLSGCGLAFAYSRRVSAWVTARRVSVLLVAGLLYNSVFLLGDGSLATLRVTGPLQVYAVLVLVIALAHVVLRTLRDWIVVTVVACLTWAGLFWAGHQVLAGGTPTRDANLSRAVDLRLLPADQLYRQGELGHDPEGLIVITGALVTMLVGVVAGKLLLRRGVDTVRMLVDLSVWTVSVLLLGLATMVFIEPFKRLWTPSFALLTAVVALMLLVLGFLLHDQPQGPRWWLSVRDAAAQPFVAMGRNALVLYFGSHLSLIALSSFPGETQLLAMFSWAWGSPRTAFAVVFVLGWFALAWALHRKRIYIHA
ncbi:hypothetical protein [Ornithinimicrobium cryptoxanthini]|uniref:Heparan-alpha-glucosaminide N-acetyltransferase catalytic domain-containing protein n=1 Tax=Ornithinimicrobium cryptoxanthini TaxID=2934161 RepID=A0ABY4YED5_9MICO|nr:hypothetical protein [Ornithinimicrobium cryptoxanthini]USQ75129.1 hypothetical protein NF557_10825 [Ornithinimicrobium cryptoxanthini]